MKGRANTMSNKKFRTQPKPERKAFLASLIFCENVKHEEGKINLYGVFQSMGLPQDYAKFPVTFTVWMHFEGMEPLRRYKMGIRQRASNKDAPHMDEFAVQASFDGSLDISTSISLTSPLPEFIDFDFLFDGVPAGIRRLPVLRAANQPASGMHKISPTEDL